MLLLQEEPKKKGGENVCWMKREATRENPIASTTFQILVWMMAKKEGGGGVAVVVGVYRRRIGLWLQYTSFSTRSSAAISSSCCIQCLGCVEEATLDKVVMMNFVSPSLLFLFRPSSVLRPHRVDGVAILDQERMTWRTGK